MSASERMWIVRAQYTGGQLVEWKEPRLIAARRRYDFLAQRAAVEWTELIEVTTTTQLERVDRWQKPASGL